jgi:hypothetical protein
VSLVRVGRRRRRPGELSIAAIGYRRQSTIARIFKIFAKSQNAPKNSLETAVFRGGAVALVGLAVMVAGR